MNPRLKRPALLSAALAATFITHAQTEAPGQKIREATLNPVIVTGTGTYRKAENSPVEVKVITARQLKDAHVSNLQEALSQLSTNITTHTNGMGTFINYNGISDDYILILENGKRVTGDDRWNRISISSIKRIEILSGAASALYGSDAIAGVINIITDNDKEALGASVTTQMRSKGRLDQDINVHLTEGKLSSYTGFNHRQADNWQVNHYQQFMEGDQPVYKLTGRPMSQAFRSNNITERLEWRISDQMDVYAKGSYYDHRTARDRNATYFAQKAATDKTSGNTTYSYTPRQAYTYDLHHATWNAGAGARWVPNKDTHLYLDIYTDNFKSDYSYWQTATTEEHDETRKHTRYYNETLKGIFRLNDRNKLSAGLETEQESLNSASDNIDKESTYTYNIFAQDEVRILKRLEGVVGLRYTYNKNFGSNVTPNVALFYHAAGIRTRLSYAEGYRTPQLSQLYATDQAKTAARYTLNNPSLKAEKNRFWNANVEYANKWMSVSVSGFINRIRDMINYRTLTLEEIQADPHLSSLYDEGWTTLRQRDNIDEATVKGLSANAKVFLPGGFSVSGGYTWSDSKAKSVTLDKKTQAYTITETPVDKSVKNVANVTVAWNHSWESYHMNIQVNGHIQGERYSSTYGYAPRYQQWDINSRHSFQLRQITIEPGIGIENIFNKRDESYWNSNFSTTTPGRSVLLHLTLTFKD